MQPVSRPVCPHPYRFNAPFHSLFSLSLRNVSLPVSWKRQIGSPWIPSRRHWRPGKLEEFQPDKCNLKNLHSRFIGIVSHSSVDRSVF